MRRIQLPTNGSRPSARELHPPSRAVPRAPRGNVAGLATAARRPSCARERSREVGPGIVVSSVSCGGADHGRRPGPREESGLFGESVEAGPYVLDRDTETTHRGWEDLYSTL
ncbi:unnamed protein product [Diplocarpon coronariae]